jgi:hypothetical protein
MKFFLSGSRHIICIAPLLLGVVFLFPSADSLQAADESARKLSGSLKPIPFSSKGTDKDIAGPKNQIIKVIEQLQASSRGNGPSPESLIEKAYSFRNDIGSLEKDITASSYLRNWREAQALGLFTDGNRFSHIIKRGPETGKTVSVEYIIPPSIMPEMSKHPANVRIVSPGRKRSEKITDESQLAPREKAYRDQFAKMIEGTQGKRELNKIEAGTKFTSIGASTEAEELERWQTAMKAAGEAAKAAPEIDLRARKGASPSHRSGYRWRIDVEVANTSRIPTEIQLEYWLIGITEEKRIYYVMKKGSVPIKLIAGASKDIPLWTNSESSYKPKSGELDGLPKKQWGKAKIAFRGFMLRAVHATGEVATFAPDQRLLDYLDDETDRSPSDLR